MTNAGNPHKVSRSNPPRFTVIPLNPRARQFVSGACALVAFLIPLKLSLVYTTLIPLVLLWALTRRWKIHGWMSSPTETATLVPLAFLLISITCAAIIGVNPLHSVSPLISLVFFALTIFVFRDFCTPYYTLLALISGQALAALHSVIDAAFPNLLPSLFLGSVTESGQLSLSLLICVGLLWQKYKDGLGTLPPTIPRVAIVSCGVSLALLASLGFYSTANLSGLALIAIWLGGLLSLRALLTHAPRSLPEARGILTLSTVHLPLLLCALLVNLKRGPWVGVVIGLATFCLFYARKLLAVIIIGAVLTSVSVPPIRERLEASYEHFTISGGRSTIWKIGLELAGKYPFGVGYHNSGILRNFSAEIPQELKHFHNNLINIAAENGIITACIFVWFIVAFVRVCFRQPLTPLHVALGCAIISWQTAGLVEYNFGDSEVTLIVWVVLGALLSESRRRERRDHDPQRADAGVN